MKLETNETASNSKDQLTAVESPVWKAAKDAYAENVMSNYDKLAEDHKKVLVKLGLGIRLDRAFATAEAKREVIASGAITKTLDELMSGAAGYTVKDIEKDLLGYVVKLAISGKPESASLIALAQSAIIADGKAAKLEALNTIRAAFAESAIED